MGNVNPPKGVATKSAISTPVTGSEKTTVKSTVAALVGFAFARVSDNTVGAIVSILTSSVPADSVGPLPARSVCRAV